MAGKSKIDPFAHVVDNDHVGIFETAKLEIHGIDVGGVPIKFAILISICAVLVAWSLIWLGRKMKNGDPPTGKLWNLVESLLFFVRDKIARPALGEHDADKYLP